MIAISTDSGAGANTCFLIALVLDVVAAAIYFMAQEARDRLRPLAPVLGWLGLAFVELGLLLS